MSSIVNANNGQLSIFSLNVRSLRKNFDDIKILIHELNYPDIVVLLEIWLYSHETSFFNVNNYVMSFTCNDTSLAGGVVIYSKPDLPIAVNPVTFLSADILKINFSQSGVAWKLLGIYRSPSNSMWSYVDELEKLLNTYSTVPNLILTGDININVDPDKALSAVENQYLDILSVNKLFLHNVGVTRPKSRSRIMVEQNLNLYSNQDEFSLMSSPYTFDILGTHIDHFIVRCASQQNWNCRRIECSISDHFGIMSVVSSKSYEQCEVNTKIIERINYRKLDEQMRNWPFIYNQRLNAEYQMQNLVSHMAFAISRATERISVSSRKHCIQPWMTPGILRCVRVRNKLFQKTSNLESSDPRVTFFKRYRNTLKNLMQRAKILHVSERLTNSSGNLREQYRIMRNHLNLPKKQTYF